MGVSAASSTAGMFVEDVALGASLPVAAESGQLWLPPVAYWSGYVSTHLTANYALGSVVDSVNGDIIYPVIGLGTP